MNTRTLLDEQEEIVDRHIARTQLLAAKTPEQLRHRTAPASWNALECIEHLDRYGDFYLPEIKKSIQAAPRMVDNQYFNPGVLGNYFVKMMQPGTSMKPMKTFADKDPIGSALSPDVVDVFILQQKELLQLIAAARHINICKAKTPVSIAPFLKLRLGDTLRFLIAHNERHLQQAERVVEKAGRLLVY